MTDQEWAGVTAILTANWPHSLPPDLALAKWRGDVDDLDPQAVLAAVETFNRDGERFPPNGGQIRHRVIELARGELDHGAAWALAMEAVRRFGHPDKPGALKWLAARSETTALAVERFGWIELCTLDLENIATHRAQFRGFYLAAADGEQRAATYAGLPGIERKAVRGGKPRQIGEALAGITEGES